MKYVVAFLIGFCLFFCFINIAKANDEGVTVTTTITDDGEDWDVAEYSLPINQQKPETTVKLETEMKEVKKEVIEVKKDEPILPTGYSILVKDEMVVYVEPKKMPEVSMWTKIKCQKLEEQQKNFHISEFDRIKTYNFTQRQKELAPDQFDMIESQHEQQFKNWRK